MWQCLKEKSTPEQLPHLVDFRIALYLCDIKMCTSPLSLLLSQLPVSSLPPISTQHIQHIPGSPKPAQAE